MLGRLVLVARSRALSQEQACLLVRNGAFGATSQMREARDARALRTSPVQVLYSTRWQRESVSEGLVQGGFCAGQVPGQCQGVEKWEHGAAFPWQI